MYFVSPKEALAQIYASPAISQQVLAWRQELIHILEGCDKRLLLVVGPCSIHNTQEALDYAHKLKALQEKVKDAFFIIMRAFVEKSRTFTGWKGLSCDPMLNGSNALDVGLLRSRQLLLDLNLLGMPIAMEFVHPNHVPYFEDLVTYGIIGARNVTSTVHRELASALSMPVGFKNTVTGDVLAAVQAAAFSKEKQTFLHSDIEGKIVPTHTSGNPFPHIILRGGLHIENYSSSSILEAHADLTRYHLPQVLIVDCAHGNSKKQLEKQQEIFYSLVAEKKKNQKSLSGIMLESYLQEGSQPFSPYGTLQPGLSITDPCLGWGTTEKIIMKVYV